MFINWNFLFPILWKKTPVIVGLPSAPHFQNWDIGDVCTADLGYFMSLVVCFGHWYHKLQHHSFANNKEQMMYRDKAALQNIAHCLPGFVNVFSHTCFQNKLKKGYPLLAVQQDVWPRASPVRLKDKLTVQVAQFIAFNSFNSLGRLCTGERW